ncbi:CaiB/BaiF CoA transferase family protein [Advenella mimigardefordensis]|uniref:Putative acyl-CoA transferase family 3 n=1 Tax=Advenella mimigardefordensis (strain DSM 17166 / LMG 22922 / DPN7) TaxID=1247726 RepID=W0PBD2_ADVMD|nr:CaiB/BaiF CoA-transferase family protein [Advenella mimigardefordensis]AHG64174.1 putative acyl-CoA transferase family 3 [Advenella mimigardefordensis DPN7]
MATTKSTNSLPLCDIKVIELAHLISGPLCGQMLADEGAEVIKVEPPGGELTRHRDPLRHIGSEKIAAYYASLNRDKKSIVLDLKNQGGSSVVRQLLESADVLLTNMRPAALKRLELDPQTLHAQYPRLIVACITGFGMENAGEHADRAGLAMVAEAMSGATGITRDHEGNPVWCGFPLGDVMASVATHSAILLALRDRERHGMGRIIDLGLVECMLPIVSVAMARSQWQDEAVSDFAGSNYHGVPCGTFPASDGYVTIGVNRDDFWRQLCIAMDRPELGTDPRYATYVQRARRQREVHDITAAFTRNHTRAEITERLIAADVPVGNIQNMDEVIEDAYLTGRGMLQQVDDGFGGLFTLPANPAWPARPAHQPRIPRLNEHREQVLDSLGVTRDQIETLLHTGAFGPTAAEPV